MATVIHRCTGQLSKATPTSSIFFCLPRPTPTFPIRIETRHCTGLPLVAAQSVCKSFWRETPIPLPRTARTPHRFTLLPPTAKPPSQCELLLRSTRHPHHARTAATISHTPSLPLAATGVAHAQHASQQPAARQRLQQRQGLPTALGLQVKAIRGVSPNHPSLPYSEGHSDMVTVLLEAGADPNLKNKDENTPLHVAAAEGREDVVKRLVQKGADVAALNKQRWQPSHWAAAGGHSSVLKQLVLSGADLHATTSTGHTCLHLCSAAGSPALFRAVHTASLFYCSPP
jgi:hypothetical protein